MKMTMTDGTVFEGTLKEYAELIAFAETHQAINDAKVEAGYVPQEGDIVVVTANNTFSKNSVGDIGKVGAEEPLADGGVCVYVPNGPTSCVRTYPTDIRKATPAEVEAYEKAVADASKSKLKAGDFVKFEEPELMDITVGKIYEVQTDDEGDLYIIDDIGDEDYSYLTQFAIKVDADEVKWSQIGRKVGEFKKGDIAEVVEYNNGHKVGTIVKITDVHADGDCYADANGVTYYYHPERLKLIAPVESTLN